MHFLSNTDGDRARMLDACGMRTVEELTACVPEELKQFSWKLPRGMSEFELEAELRSLSAECSGRGARASFLGAGVYDHYVPAVVDTIASRGEFLTAYTPYQGEASQGSLQTIYEFQSLICELTGMDYSNASMYDGAQSLAEAVCLALRVTGRKTVVLPESLHPDYRLTVKTYLSCLDARVVEAPMSDGGTDLGRLKALLNADVAAVAMQQPNFFGYLEEAEEIAAAAKGAGALLIACVNPVSLGVLKTPGEYGADIAVGDGQPLGNPASFGGPHFGFFAVREPYLRQMPGRIAGLTRDKEGRRAFVLTLQAREQHIRRQKATSNICTNHALCALRACVHLSYLGPVGLRKLALLNLEKAHEAHARLLGTGGAKKISDRPFFNEFALRLTKDGRAFARDLEEEGLTGPLDLSKVREDMNGAYLFAVTEKRTPGDVDRLVRAVSR